MQRKTSTGNGGVVLGPSWLVRLLIMSPISALYNVLRWIIPHVDDAWAVRIVHVLTWPVLFLLRNQRMINMRRLFGPRGWTQAQYRALDKTYLRHNAQLIVENIRLLHYTPEQVREYVVFQGEEHLAAALQRGRGALLVGNHIGNWLFSAAFLSARGYNLSGVAFEIPIRSIEKHMQGLWRRYHLNITNVGKGAPAAARQAFKRNEPFVVLMDVSLRTVRRKWLRTGGAAINVDTGPARLALMTGAPILHLANHRRADSRFVISISPEIHPDDFVGEHPEDDLTQYWLDLLSDELHSWPEQWWLMTLVPLKLPADVPETSVTRPHPVTAETM